MLTEQIKHFVISHDNQIRIYAFSFCKDRDHVNGHLTCHGQPMLAQVRLSKPINTSQWQRVEKVCLFSLTLINI